MKELTQQQIIEAFQSRSLAAYKAFSNEGDAVFPKKKERQRKELERWMTAVDCIIEVVNENLDSDAK